MRYLKFVMGWMLAVLLAACGGGGNPGSSTTTTSTTTTSPTLTLSLVNAAGTTLSVNSISKSATYYARVVVTSASGTVLANQLVTFSTDFTIATLAGNAAAATALTDSSGVAKVLISPLTLTTTGAATLSASATVSGAVVTGSLNFGTTASNVTLSSMAASPTSIGALETSAVAVVAAVDGTVSSGVVVNFTASCGSFSPSSATTTSSGQASSTYQSVAGCGGNPVTLTASASGAATNAATVISVTAAKAANVVFSSATPTLMYVSSAASGSKTSIVKFQVLDSSSTGMASQAVSMSLSSASIASGVKFSLSGSTSTSAQTVTTDSSGFASITLASGTLPTTASVTATLVSDSTVSASSLGLVVTTGAATQNAASLSATKLSIEAWNTDGVTTSLTMRVADRMGNPVPDGTSVNFVASAGLVTGSCTTTTSACSVTYTSQGTRPINGRVAILAYLDGEESFIDVNGDNIWQSGETFYDVGKAYIDLNEDGSWASGEQIIDTSTNVAACVDSTNAYPAIVSTCDGTWSSAIRVRKQTIITLATSNASITRTTTKAITGFRVWIHDANANANINGNVSSFNAMPTGTIVSASIGTAGATCTVVAASPNVVVNSPNGGFHDIVLSGDADCTSVTVNVKVTTPGGISTTQSL